MISVLIPTYNDEDTLDLCLASMVDLAEEVCVVDDASTDKTMSILEDVARVAPYDLRVERNGRRMGWVANRQRLLEMATYDRVLCTDADCVVREEMIEGLKTLAHDLTPTVGYFLPLICLMGDVFHTNRRVIEGPDVNHCLFRRTKTTRYLSAGGYSGEHLIGVSLLWELDPVLFHLKGVRSDRRLIERHYARGWFAEGAERPYDDYLMAKMGLTQDELPAWIQREALRLCLSEGILEYDPTVLYSYPAVMREELGHPRYRFVYDGQRIVGRKACTY